MLNLYTAEVLTVLPEASHLMKSYPALGVADTVTSVPVANEPAPEALPPTVLVIERGYKTGVNTAFKEQLFAGIVKPYVAEVLPEMPEPSHLTKVYPALGVAVTVTSAPATKEPAPEALPPVVLVIERAYETGANSAYNEQSIAGIVNVYVADVLPGTPEPVHPTNTYPSAGVAITVTSAPSSFVPAPDAVPPADLLIVSSCGSPGSKTALEKESAATAYPVNKKTRRIQLAKTTKRFFIKSRPS